MAQQKKDNTKKIRDLNPYRFNGGNGFNEFFALAMNSIKVRCTDPAINFGYLEESFFKYQILNSNMVGYDGITKKFYRATVYGINEYWQPTKITFQSPIGADFTRTLTYAPDPIGAYFIEGFPVNISISDIIQEEAAVIETGKDVINQNLEAVKTPFICVVKDTETRLSIETALQQRRDGKPVVIVDSSIGEALKGVQTYTDYLVDRVDEFIDKRRNLLLNKLGTMTANVNKRERVQVGEVNATVGQCEDYLYSLIDNVNRQFKSYNLPFEMEANTSTEELYTDNIINNNEKGDNNND